jgi:hypothetical protein
MIKISRKSFTKTLCALTNVDEETLQAIGANLRKDGLVSFGGREAGFRHLNLSDATNFLLGLLATENPGQVSKVVRVVSHLKSKDGVYLGDAVAAILADPETAGKVEYISVFRNSGKAVIGWSRGVFPGNYGERDLRQDVFSPEGADMEMFGMIVEAKLTRDVLNSIILEIHKAEKSGKILNLK